MDIYNNNLNNNPVPVPVRRPQPELPVTQSPAYAPVEPGNSAHPDENTPLFTRVLRTALEETAEQLEPVVPTAATIPAVNPAIPTLADLNAMTAAFNQMAVQTGALWTIPQAYAGQLASTLINVLTVNDPPPKDDDRETGTESIEAAPFAQSGGGVSL